MVEPTVMAGGWAVTTRSSTARPATFGLYASCDARRRCVRCDFECESERPIIELSRRAGGAPVLCLELNHSANHLRSMQVQIRLPSSPGLGGYWTPIWNAAKFRMELVSRDATTIAVIEPGGSLAAKPLAAPLSELRWKAALMQDHWSELVSRQSRTEALDGASLALSLSPALGLGVR